MIISAVEYFVDIEEVSGSTPLSSTKHADVAQMVEQRIENPCVTGSIPVFGTKLTNNSVCHIILARAFSSMDRIPCFELGDVGSIPARPAKID